MIAYEKTITPEQMVKEGSAYDKLYDGDTENGAVLLGQSIGLIDKIEEVTDIIDRIMKETETAIKNNYSMLK